MSLHERPKCLWKLTIDPRGRADPQKESFSFCHKGGIVGIGWQLDRRPTDKSDADKLFEQKDPKRGRVGWNIMVHRIAKGDHVWVYGDREYYICRILSDWEYEVGGAWDDNDIHNFRRAEWKPVPAEFVPGIVRRKLTMHGTAQKITDDVRWLDYSHWLLATDDLSADITQRIDYDALGSALKQCSAESVFEVLDPDETEDLVGFYLQAKLAWLMVKSSAYRSQRSVECQFQRVSSGQPQVGYMQVKSGKGEAMDAREYEHLAGPNCWVYLFSTARNPYATPDRSTHEKLVCLPQDRIKEFLAANLRLLPYAMQAKLALWARALINSGA